MVLVDFVRSSRLVHAEYADAAVIAAGTELVVLAGVCPLDEQGAVTAPDDVAAQMRRTLANLEVALGDCGVGLEHVADVRILVATTRRADLGAAWTAFREHFGDHDVPATLVGVTVLGYENQLVELEVVAARPAR